MGEARLKRRRLADILKDEPICIYCGSPATTLDHMPPITLFNNRDRPKGMEFPACELCNGGTKRTEQVVAMLCRAMCEPTGVTTAPDAKAIMQAVKNNDLKTYLEFRPSAEQLVRASSVYPRGGPINIGPRCRAHMRVFLSKLGMALYRQVVGRRLPSTGGVRSLWYSNFQALSKSFPGEALIGLPRFEALAQGRKTTDGQFEYTWQTTDTGRLFRFVVVFRFSFLANIFVATEREAFDDLPGEDTEVWPGQLTTFAPSA